MKFAEREFAGLTKVGSASLSAHIAVAEKMLKKKLKSVASKHTNQCPDKARHIWEWFLELHSQRTAGGFAQNPISFVDIEAWARLTGRIARSWEVKALVGIDQLFLAQKAKDDRNSDDKGSS